jgi:hypothetical protein
MSGLAEARVMALLLIASRRNPNTVLIGRNVKLNGSSGPVVSAD